MTLGQVTTPNHPIRDAILETVGGGVNVETLTATRTIGITDAQYHVFLVTSARTVVLPGVNTALAGYGCRITNSVASTGVITVVDGDGTVIGWVYPGGSTDFRQQGTSYYAFQAGIGSKAVKVLPFTATTDEITAVASAGAYVYFNTYVPLPASILRAGAVLGASALLQITNASGTVTCKGKIAIGPPKTFTVKIDTATASENYGVALTRPSSTSVTIGSGVGATKVSICAAIVAAWNAVAALAAVATATTDGIDTMTFTAVDGQTFEMAEGSNSAKMTLADTWSPTTLVESTAVNPTTTSDYHMLSSDLNVLEAPAASAAIVAMGSWATKIDVGGTNTKDSDAYPLLPTTLATNGFLTLAVGALWSATNASTKVKLAQLNVWLAR